MRTPHAVGTLPSRLRTMVGSLGGTIREQAAALGMPHATLARRLQRPEDFTIAEAEHLAKVVTSRGPTRYSLTLRSTGR